MLNKTLKYNSLYFNQTVKGLKDENSNDDNSSIDYARVWER